MTEAITIYQTEFGIFFRWMKRLSLCSVSPGEGGEIGMLKAGSLLCGILGIDSFEFESMPQGLSGKDTFTDAQIMTACQKYESVLKIHPDDAHPEENQVEIFKSELEAINENRLNAPESYVVYQEVYRSEDEDRDPAEFDLHECLFLFDQNSEKIWQIARVDGIHLLSLSHFQSHVMISGIRDEELEEVYVSALPECFNWLDVLKTIPGKMTGLVTTGHYEDNNEIVFECSLEPLAIYRDGLVAPHPEIDAHKPSLRAISYISGFAGLAIWADVDPCSLKSDIEGGAHLDGIEVNPAQLLISSIVMATGIIESLLAKKGYPDLTPETNSESAKIFRDKSHLQLCFHLSNRLAYLIIYQFDDNDESRCIINNPDLEPMDHGGLEDMIPGSSAKNMIRLFSFFKRCDQVQIACVSDDFDMSLRVPSDGDVTANVLLIRAQEGKISKLWRIITRLNITEGSLHNISLKEMFNGLSDEQIAGLATRQSFIGFDYSGRFAVSDACSFSVWTHEGRQVAAAEEDNFIELENIYALPMHHSIEMMQYRESLWEKGCTQSSEEIKKEFKFMIDEVTQSLRESGGIKEFRDALELNADYFFKKREVYQLFLNADELDRMCGVWVSPDNGEHSSFSNMFELARSVEYSCALFPDVKCVH